MIRLDRYLAEVNAGTRSELKKGIRKGLASVNGEVRTDPGFLLSGTETVVYRGIDRTHHSFSYYMLNKPAGVISATSDEHQKTVMDLFPKDVRRGLSPVGRLDKDTEGLLLITNDGELAHRLLSPRRHVDKTYYVRVTGEITEEDRTAFSAGMTLSSQFTAMPAELEILSSGECSEALVTIREGKFHQIKRMFHMVGKEVLYLKRLSVGTLDLDPKLAPGEYRELTPEEIDGVKGKQ